MKKIFLIISMSLIVFGCASGSKQIQKIVDQVYIGMSIDEFNSKVKDKKTIVMEEGYTVYLVEKRNWYDTDEFVADHMYFYFINNRLSSVDKGVIEVDRRIWVDYR